MFGTFLQNQSVRLNMVCAPWLLAVVVVCVCNPGVEGQCWDSSHCKDLPSEDKILECIHLFRSGLQDESPEPRSAAQQSTEESLSLGILLAALTSGERALDADPEPHSDKRHSYSMEHFRWGKPIGHKRRPIKVYASSLEGGDSSEGTFPLQARRQLSSWEDEMVGALGNQGAKAQTKVVPRTLTVTGLQDKKDGSYRMGHFRWGSPTAIKRYGGFMKPYTQQSHKPLITLLKHVTLKNEQ
ncbi:pro-opiomelanocortin B precursor [Oncorhynchus mykiss]|uniref:Pro-opiomelanocortin B n=1 Tax=Oncorhynchus mykiss TaxID=8022 RepID=COLI2_ONCMY|nr:pro-opiomelanocortin B precursor [Oncorhynchus mykiss]Q04618.1 RecName: Full=Pro-opiomelanocortin B; Short=POMC-B; AltName: Full=Corticotropin-lipotropin B; Contains: RecName: Full=NPP 2; Contains: RecName: Full=Corticotropin; AltName: Full=Adrenocorticotropic hormone; Short=ACTH; Contains: RecName: Full=Melanocyte-stimulating hormone alpha 2; Short=Alpha-MSH 2; AltName: Full=Melanotropin alpha 2; Contains: RecName: Full=Corticotropin-like intermediary peptide 2; Short=CLIP-2; Contains: RecName